MKRKIASILTALAIAAGLVTVIATPAQAALPWDCPVGTGCVWLDYGGVGTRGVITVGTNHVGQCWNFTSTFNDAVSSASVSYGSGHFLRLYRDANCANNIWYRDITVSNSPHSMEVDFIDNIASSFKII